MHLEKIEALVGILRDSNVGELELTEGASTIRLTRFSHAVADRRDDPRASVAAADTSPPSDARSAGRAPVDEGAPEPSRPSDETIAATPAAPSDAAIASPPPPVERPTVVTAPLFGVVHLAPSPLDPPFVRVGDRIAAGDTLCTIEAMKTFNVIEAEEAGVVTDILTQTGVEVAPGQPLFRVAP